MRLWASAVAIIGVAVTGWVWPASFAAPRDALPLPDAERTVEYPPGDVIILPRIDTPTVDTGALDWRARPITIACSTCHATRAAEPGNRTAEALDEFHQGLIYAHGTLSCVSCHNRDDYDTLALADGTPLPYAEAMALCAQCHGPQYRDYKNGSHGGMTGFWDRSRGPRVRNHCLACHDAHAPAYPTMFPVGPPNDRFLTVDAQDAAGDAHE